MVQLARMTAQVAPGQSIGRALRLLACFSEARPSHTLSELSRLLELAPSTVSRLLSVLEEYGYVRRSDGNGHYTLGLAPIALASVAITQSDLRRQSLPFLEMLADTSHYNANVAVLYAGDVLYLARVPAAKELRVYAITGTRNAPHSTAVGKILLAALPEEGVRALYTDRPMEPLTSQTITTMDALLAELARIRTQGCAVDDEEFATGRRCVAAPVRDESGQIIAAISLSSLPASLPAEEFAQAARLVKQFATHISRTFGATG
ncbi:MAG: IclR family transcriptional regulator [Chloroflexota bacterium]|nr:IclR family transcriptional regulator [Chloroflexota bacterium]